MRDHPAILSGVHCPPHTLSRPVSLKCSTTDRPSFSVSFRKSLLGLAFAPSRVSPGEFHLLNSPDMKCILAHRKDAERLPGGFLGRMNDRWPPVSIGIVTWNSAADLPCCFDGIARQGYPDLELIVVDNASADHSVEFVRQRWPTATVVQNDTNQGFSRAHNTAIRASRGEYYLALNPDVELQPGFIEKLVSALKDRPEFGSAAAKLWQRGLGNPPLIDSTGLFLDRSRHQYLRGRNKPDHGQYELPEEVFGVDGAAPMYRRSMLEDVKVDGEFFDEAFFAYMEDVDLAWRARLLGWRCWYEPAATAYHVRTFKPGRRRGMPVEQRREAVKNRYLMILKNEGCQESRRDWRRILGYEAAIWGYILLLEQRSVGALPLLRREWRRARTVRSQIWGRARAESAERFGWFA